jgi:hypothetical protein
LSKPKIYQYRKKNERMKEQKKERKKERKKGEKKEKGSQPALYRPGWANRPQCPAGRGCAATRWQTA